jgi:CheY-like chemotaxis protein
MVKHVSETNINELTNEVSGFFRPEAEKKNLKILCINTLPSHEANIRTDKDKLFAVLSNLIKNAIKFTESGSIKIGYDLVYEQYPPHLRFFVKDTGSGISGGQKKLIFERFRQGSESLTRNYEGSGLGLAISKAYIEMLGGEIWVESNNDIFKKIGIGPENGSTFFFSIPYQQTIEVPVVNNETAVKPSERSMKNRKTLIVEDDKISQRFLITLMSRNSEKVLIAENGYDAVEMVKMNPDLDLVLMDIKMPLMDGYEATRQIRKFNKKVPIIAQTAYGLSGDRALAIEAGCTEYISKPVNPTQLVNLINSILS